MALPIYTHIPNLKVLTKIFFKLSHPKGNLCGGGGVTVLNPKYPRLSSGVTINALYKMSGLVCFLSSWRKEGLIFVHLLSSCRKEGFIFFCHFVGEQTSKIIVYQFCTDNPLVKHAQLVIIHVNALYKMGHVLSALSLH